MEEQARRAKLSKAALGFCRNTCKVGEEKSPPNQKDPAKLCGQNLHKGNKAELFCSKTECNSSLAHDTKPK